MSELKPVTRSQLIEKIYLGNSKCLIFGQTFLRKIREYTGETELPDGFDGAPQADEGLFLRLTELRHKHAQEQDKSDISIMSDYTLYDMCVKKPQNEEDFRAIYGIGEFKSAKYCTEFTKCIAEYLKKN
ncbi:MAG: HRDC domain-containing protein [Firmicutes bacterium]|nr:HRDC domain-containing protein [Bacillota bacterium]